ncbi:MAG: outer membrane lipoprotein carrier protein LolA [Candidatus Binatia bacterium]|nr:outer membrane lipoprotein carrier protein LolA [Candidatus Binatia bacterium]
MARLCGATLLAVVLGALALLPAHAQDSPAQQLAAILGKRTGQALDARFRQTKHIALLRGPLVSRGTVRFELPDGLRWEVVEPEPLVVDTRGGVLRVGPPDQLQEVPA